MGRFLSSNPGSWTPSTPPSSPPVSAASSAPPAPRISSGRSSNPPPQVVLSDAKPKQLQTVSVYLLCLFLIGILANDIAQRFFGGRAYITMLTGPLVFLMFMASGQALRGLQSRLGVYWLLLMGWMVLAMTFSTYRRGSFDFLSNYLPRVHMILFLVCAFVMSLRQVRTLIHAQITIAALVLGMTLKYGQTGDDGRLGIPGSYLMENTNDLALNLLIALAFGLYWFLQRASKTKLIFSLPLLGGLSFFLLKTGSRGSFLAFAVLFCSLLYLSRNKGRIALLLVPGMLLVAATPTQTLRRLALLFSPSAIETSGSERMMEADMASVGSQNQRRELIWKSLKLTAQNPLFGVGPAQFPTILWQTEKEKGVHYAALGTHNAYTQLSAECGVPAALLFIATIFTAIRTNARIYKAAVRAQRHAPIADMAFCLFGVLVAFSVNAFFHHVAFTSTIPIAVGLTICLETMAIPLLRPRPVRTETA